MDIKAATPVTALIFHPHIPQRHYSVDSGAAVPHNMSGEPGRRNGCVVNPLWATALAHTVEMCGRV
ncbi:MAG: hypothetical protein IKX56_06170 [Muribaculaceae bacterium]|nr:hypothetical protein [Muribaculaceae bacterium]